MSIKSKYLKYKNKYLNLKKLIGGEVNDDAFSSSSIIYSFSIQHPLRKKFIQQTLNIYYKNEPTIIYDDFQKCILEKFNNDNEFIISYLPEPLIKKIIELPLTRNDNGNRTIIINQKNKLLEFAGYDTMLYISTFDNNIEFANVDDLHRTIALNHINKSSTYIADLIIKNKPNSSIYFALAPGTLPMYYIPEFITEQLTEDPALTYTIIINNIDYFSSTYNINTSTNKVIADYKILHPELSSRIYFIHLMMLLPTPELYNSELFTLFLNNISNKTKTNYCYFGLQKCGLIFKKEHINGRDEYLKELDVNYIFVGCDGLLKRDKYIKKNGFDASTEITADDLYIDNLIIRQKFIDKINSL